MKLSCPDLWPVCFYILHQTDFFVFFSTDNRKLLISPLASWCLWHPAPILQCHHRHTPAPWHCQGAVVCKAAGLWQESVLTGRTPAEKSRRTDHFNVRLLMEHNWWLVEPQTDLDWVEQGTKFPQQSLPHVVAATGVGQDQHWSPTPAAGRRQLQTHNSMTFNLTATVTAGTFTPTPWLPRVLHLDELFWVPAAKFVDTVEVLRRDDEAAELAQVTQVFICQAVHTVVMNCGLTPNTPRRGTGEQGNRCTIVSQD